MPKKIINDILVNKKSIRDIPISLEKKAVVKKPTVNYRNRKPINPKFVIWAIAIIALLALFFGISLIFSSATLTITPRLQKVIFTGDTYIAKLNSVSTSTLSFEVLKIDKTLGASVEATETKAASTKVSGQIIIYNSYSSASQRLINNTRFEAANGKIYRLSSSVDVPGTKVVAGKTVPGSVEATVFADEAGDSYNLKLADLAGDFKIPGFKGSPRYNAFYARSKTDITGGLIGQHKIVADTVRQTTEDSLKTTLKENLLKELYAIKPDSYIVFNNSYSVDYTDLPDTTDSSNKVTINVHGILNSVVFNDSKLANYVAMKKIANFDGLPVSLIVNDNLAVIFSAKDPVNLWKNDTLSIKFSGDANIKWVYDANLIKKDLVGKAESDLAQILSKYKNQVQSIKVSFSPIWTKSFPDNVAKIKVQELAL